MKPLKVLVACEYSGIVRDAFLEKGHDAWSCDLLPTESKSNRQSAAMSATFSATAGIC